MNDFQFWFCVVYVLAIPVARKILSDRIPERDLVDPFAVAWLPVGMLFIVAQAAFGARFIADRLGPRFGAFVYSFSVFLLAPVAVIAVFLYGLYKLFPLGFL